MGKKTGWGVKWDVVKIGAGLFFPAGIPAAIMYYGYDRNLLGACCCFLYRIACHDLGVDGRRGKVLGWHHRC